jgi:PleD family two-component response regulator
MAAATIRTLIAAPPVVIQRLASALDELGVEVHPGATSEEAEGHLASKLDFILVCYAFDDVRPYRFIGRIRSDAVNANTPVILVRALPVPLGKSQEWEIRQAYKSIGVNDFLNYSQLLHDAGSTAADEALRQCVLSVARLPYISAVADRR